MPVVNLRQPILGLDGVPCKEEGSDKELLMLTMCISVLSILDEEETKKASQDGHLGGKLKLERFLLKQRIYNEGLEGVQLSLKEIVLLQDLLGRYTTDIVVGRIYAVLDPDKTYETVSEQKPVKKR